MKSLTSTLLCLTLVMLSSQDLIARKYPKGLLNCVCKVKGVDCGCEKPLLGRPLRIIYANCQSLLHEPKIFADSIAQALKNNRYHWIFPILCEKYSRSGEIEVKYNVYKKIYEKSFGPPYGISEFDLFEIASVWPVEKGYNPVLVQCFHNTFYHIPELGPDNLTHICPTFKDIEKEHPIPRKSQYLIRYLELNGNEDSLFSEITEKRPIESIKSFGKNIDFGFDYGKSEFKDVENIEKTLSFFFCSGEAGALLKDLRWDHSKPYNESCPERTEGFRFVKYRYYKSEW